MATNYPKPQGLSRRNFIKFFNMGLASLVAGGQLPLPHAHAATSPGIKIIHLLLEGGLCPLSLFLSSQSSVVDYVADIRRTLFRPFIPQWQQSSNGKVIFSPHTSSLRNLYNQNQLRIVRGCGLNKGTTGSHELALDRLYAGNPSAYQYGSFSGVLARAAALAGFNGVMDVWGVGAMNGIILNGSIIPVITKKLNDSFHHAVISENDSLHVTGGRAIRASRDVDPENKIKQELIDGWVGFELIQDKKAALASLNLPVPFDLGNSAGQLLDAACRLIIGDAVKAKIVNVGYGNFDTHGMQNLALSNMVPQFDSALATAIENLTLANEKAIIVVTTEFGRTLKQNGGHRGLTVPPSTAMQDPAGSDHGGASTVMVLSTPGVFLPLPSSGLDGDPETYESLSNPNNYWNPTVGWPDLFSSTIGHALNLTPEALFPMYAGEIRNLQMMGPV